MTIKHSSRLHVVIRCIILILIFLTSDHHGDDTQSVTSDDYVSSEADETVSQLVATPTTPVSYFITCLDPGTWERTTVKPRPETHMDMILF